MCVHAYVHMWILYVLNSVYNKLLIVHPAVTRVLIGVCQPPVGEEGPAEEEGQEEEEAAANNPNKDTAGSLIQIRERRGKRARKE